MSKKILKLLAYPFIVIYLKLKSLKELSRLRSYQDDTLKILANVIDGVMHNRLLPQEKAWIDRIEMLRSNLIKSSNLISIIDYGAGEPDSKLTASQMNQGRVVNSTVGEVCKLASKSYKWAFLLFKLIRKFRPNIAIEMGTAMGITTAYQAAALELNQQGKILTLEGSETLANLANENFKKLGLDNIGIVIGRFSDTLQDVLSKNAPIDFVFVDGHHDKEATIGYFKQILPYLADKAVLVFDDISWSKGMEQAWRTIIMNNNIRAVLDLHVVGICLFQRMPAFTESESFKIMI